MSGLQPESDSRVHADPSGTVEADGVAPSGILRMLLDNSPQTDLNASVVERTFLRSLLLFVALSGYIFAGAEGDWWPGAVTPLLAVVLWLLRSAGLQTGLRTAVINFLAGLALILVATEFTGGNLADKLLAGAHLLVYMTWIVLLSPMRTRQYWWLCGLSLLQLAVGSVLTKDAWFGAALIGMLFLGLWTLSVFTLYRARLRIIGGESQEGASAQGLRRVIRLNEQVSVRNGVQLDTGEKWIGRGFRWNAVFTFVASLLLALIVFVVFPRHRMIWSGQPMFDTDDLGINSRNHRTGFTEQVRLGEIGNIMQTDARVMQFEILRGRNDRARDAVGEPITVDNFLRIAGLDEIRFRGNAMGYYVDGEWSRGLRRLRYNEETTVRRLSRIPDDIPVLRFRVTQDPPVGRFAFAVYPISEARPLDESRPPLMRRISYSLIHDTRRRSDSQAAYEVGFPVLPEDREDRLTAWGINPPGDTREEEYRGQVREREEFFARQMCITPDIAERLPQLHTTVTELCAAEGGEELSFDEKTRRILGFLEDDSFSYSLTATRTDTSLDPIEDFLMNHRVGHCEYFASACALMLQAADVPARVVNGFKGSEVNQISGLNEVRQKHAHSWLEAWNGRCWVTLDPTPADLRSSAVASAGGWTFLADFKSVMQQFWFSAMDRMNPERQSAMLAPIKDRLTTAAEMIRERGVTASLKHFLREVVLKPDKWFSWQGLIVTWVLLFAGGIAVRKGLHRLPLRWLRAVRKRLSSSERAVRSVIRFYARFCALCESQGLTQSESDTAIEFAHAAVERFGDRLTDPELRQAPERIARAFNRVRFGRQDLTIEEADEIGRWVSRLSECLSKSQAA